MPNSGPQLLASVNCFRAAFTLISQNGPVKMRLSCPSALRQMKVCLQLTRNQSPRREYNIQLRSCLRLWLEVAKLQSEHYRQIDFYV